MKLFYLTDTVHNSGGMEKALIFKANFLSAEYGYEVTIVTAHQKGRPPFFPLDSSVRLIDLDVNTHIPGMIWLYMRRLRKLLSNEKPDIVDSLCSKELPHLPKLKGNFVKMAEFHFCREKFIIEGKSLRLRRMQKAVGKLDSFVVLTKEDRDAWAPYCRNSVQIYNPVTLQSFDETPGPASNRCISGGRFERQKNYPLMISAWETVHARHPDWTLDLYGNGRKKKEVEKLIREKGLEGSIHIHPPVKNFREELAGSAIYLMSSLYEGFPLVLVETASIGLPCVSVRCPCGPSEFIEDGIDGFTCQRGDALDMAAKICTLIENPHLRSCMGKRLVKKSALFTPEKIMPAWDRLFKRLASEKHG